MILGICVTAISFLSFLVRFSAADEKAAIAEKDRQMSMASSN